MKSEGINKKKGFDEILNSPVFRNFVISEDGNTTGIIAYLKKKPEPVELSNEELEIYKDKIKKVNETILGIEGGAPAGPTPLTALQFNKGLIDVPGVEFADVASGVGSYTMSAWIKPVGLFAPSFIFGQSNQITLTR